MVGIRIRFMDLLYAAVIGNALQLIHPQHQDVTFYFCLFLLLVILEDFFLYYADVAPENDGSEGLSFFGMVTEIAILATWFFTFVAFTSGDWNFLIFLGVFFGLKTFAGFINCAVSGSLFSVKFLRETYFLISLGALAWVMLRRTGATPGEDPAMLGVVAGAWLIQTVLWWTTTKLFRRAEGKRAVLRMQQS